jgi:hypothetical protein
MLTKFADIGTAKEILVLLNLPERSHGLIPEWVMPIPKKSQKKMPPGRKTDSGQNVYLGNFLSDAKQKGFQIVAVGDEVRYGDMRRLAIVLRKDGQSLHPKQERDIKALLRENTGNAEVYRNPGDGDGGNIVVQLAQPKEYTTESSVSSQLLIAEDYVLLVPESETESENATAA